MTSKKLYHLCLLLLILFMVNSSGTPLCKTPYQALTIVPVADLVGQSLQSSARESSIIQRYHRIPLCGKQGKNICPRIHQAVFNEVVTVLEEHGDEVKIKINNVFYELSHDPTPQDIYWSLKKNFVNLDSLQQKNKYISIIPEPIKYYSKQDEANQNIVTLKKPYYEASLGLTFSAGTRFVKTDTQADDCYVVFALDSRKMAIKKIWLPKNSCLALSGCTIKEKIKTFVALIKEWAHIDKGFIPYVWGGCSFTDVCYQEHFSEITSYKPRGSYYQRTGYKKFPFCGLDCAGLVMRAAQICEIPYFFKNTLTLAHGLQSLKEHESLHEGDLIWFPGHVLIVSNVKKNMIVEARSYSHGYGKVHESALNKVFKEINTFSDLIKAYNTQEPLYRLDNNGVVMHSIPTYKILKLSSIWNQH